MRPRHIILAALTVAALATGACARAGGGTISVTGSVTDDVTVLAAPRLGVEPTSTPDPGWSRVASVPVSVGETVTAGTVVATLDDAVVRSGIAFATGQLAEARAQEGVIGEKIDEVATKRSDVAKTRTDLEDTLAKLRDQRDQVASQLAQARKLAAQMPAAGAGGGVPGGGAPGSGAPGGGTPGSGAPQDPRAIVARLTAALAKLDAGIAKAEDGLAKLNDASAKLADARSALGSAGDAAAAMVQAREAGIALAEARASLAKVRAPVDGVIVAAPLLGSVQAAGAPLVQIRPIAGRNELVTYLTAQQASFIAPGDRADVRADSLGTRVLRARVKRVGSEYVYVPSRFATREIHLLRAFEVRLELTSAATLPAGTPVDLVIHPR